METEISWDFLTELNDVFKKLRKNIYLTAPLVGYDLEKYDAFIDCFIKMINLGNKLHNSSDEAFEKDMYQETLLLIKKVAYNEYTTLCKSYENAIQTLLNELKSKQLVPDVQNYFSAIKNDMLLLSIHTPANLGGYANTNELKNNFNQFYDIISKMVDYFTSINCYRLGVESTKQGEEKQNEAEQQS